MSASIEFWQTEWCPFSSRVRQRLTEPGLSFTAHQVPADPGAPQQLQEATGHTTIPVLVAGAEIVAGEEAIVSYLNAQVAEPPEAEQQQARAAQVKRTELAQACPEFAAATR